MISKSELVQVGVIIVVLALLASFYIFLSTREITDQDYERVALEVANCPDAESALQRVNKDHVIDYGELHDFEGIVSDYAKQDQRAIRAYNIQIAKGLLKGPPRQPTCVLVDDSQSANKLPKKP